MFLQKTFNVILQWERERNPSFVGNSKFVDQCYYVGLKFERAEMQMVRCPCGVSMKDRRTSEEVGQPRRTWLESVEADMAELEIDREDVHDRKKWRNNIIRGNPTLSENIL